MHFKKVKECKNVLTNNLESMSYAYSTNCKYYTIYAPSSYTEDSSF